MAMIINPHPLENALIKHGLVPPECRLLEVVLAVKAAPLIRYEVYLTHDKCIALSTALAEAAAEQASKKAKP